MKVERIQGVAWRKVGDEMVVIHLARHRIFGLDCAAGLIWESLSEPQDMETLEAIASEGAPKGADVVDAVHLFVADLAEEGLVEVAGQLPEACKSDNLVSFPRIEWREELQQFAGQCHLVPGQSWQCNQHPGGS
ncbi:MAG: PqqD family protein [Acidobacteriota bacterium]